MTPESVSSIKLPTHSARIMRSVMETAGLDWHSLLTKANIAAEVIDDSTGFVTGAQELLLQDGFVEATRALPGVWFRMGLQYRLMTFGPLGLALMTAETFGAGLRHLSTFRALTFSLMHYRPVEQDGELIALEADDREVPESCRDFCQECCLGAAARVLGDMHPGLSPILRVETVLADRHGRHEWAAALGAPIVFGAPATRLILKKGVACAPLPLANALLEETYRDLCSTLVQQSLVRDEIVRQVYNLLICSSCGFPTPREASRVLGLSERTLYRRLGDEGWTFGEILAQVRQQRALCLLDNTALSVEHIADTLGFAETASFSRAFKRWTGLSPLPFRNQSPARRPRGATPPVPRARR